MPIAPFNTTSSYDILLYQGQSYFLTVKHQDTDGTVIDVNGATYSAKVQVRKSSLVDEMVLYLSSDGWPNGSTGGGITGQFLGTTSDPGIMGTGGISLNYSAVTGDIRLEIPYAITSKMPTGRHFYDLDLYNKDTDITDKLLSGTFEVVYEVTR
jgi:hypothetical protein